MSDNQMAELYERLVAAKHKNVPVQRVFLRGFNAGVDFAIKAMRLSCDEVVEEDVSHESAEAAE
jgi:hypothetical protein